MLVFQASHLFEIRVTNQFHKRNFEDGWSNCWYLIIIFTLKRGKNNSLLYNPRMSYIESR